LYLNGRRVSQEEYKLKEGFSGDSSTPLIIKQQRKSEGIATITVDTFPKRLSLAEYRKTALGVNENQKRYDIGNFGNDNYFARKSSLGKGKTASSLELNENHLAQEDAITAISEDEYLKYIAKEAGFPEVKSKALETKKQRNKSEEVKTRTVTYLSRRVSLPESRSTSLSFDEQQRGNDEENLGNDNYFTIKPSLEEEKRASLEINEGRDEVDMTTSLGFGKQQKRNDEENLGNDNYFTSYRKSSLGEGKLNEGNDEEGMKNHGNCAEMPSYNEEEEEEDTRTSASEEESQTGSYFNIKDEILTFFNKLEADSSFLLCSRKDLHSSTSSEEQNHDGDYDLLQEIESVYLQGLKENCKDKSSSSTSEDESDTPSYFNMSREMNNRFRNFKKRYSQYARSEGQDCASVQSTPGVSSDSGSFFHIQGELESRLQNLELHLNSSSSGSGSEECQSMQDEVTILSSREGSYFNMQDEIEMRLEVILLENTIFVQ
jgi:hypothetical protein